MQQWYELFFKNGLRPLSMLPEALHIEPQLTGSDLSTLLLLHFHKRLTMSEMAEYLGAPLSTATSIAKRLVRKGLIYREKSTHDQRMIINRLTEEGELMAQEAAGTMQMMFERVESALSPDELQQFIRLSLKVASALQRKPASSKLAGRTIEIE